MASILRLCFHFTVIYFESHRISIKFIRHALDSNFSDSKAPRKTEAVFNRKLKRKNMSSFVDEKIMPGNTFASAKCFNPK